MNDDLWNYGKAPITFDFTTGLQQASWDFAILCSLGETTTVHGFLALFSKNLLFHDTQFSHAPCLKFASF